MVLTECTRKTVACIGFLNLVSSENSVSIFLEYYIDSEHAHAEIVLTNLLAKIHRGRKFKIS